MTTTHVKKHTHTHTRHTQRKILKHNILIVLFASELTLLQTARAHEDMCQLPLFHAAHYRFYLFILFCFRTEQQDIRTCDYVKI